MEDQKPSRPSLSLELEPGSVALVISAAGIDEDEETEFSCRLAYNLPTDMAPVKRVLLHRVGLGIQLLAMSMPEELVKMGELAIKSAEGAVYDAQTTSAVEPAKPAETVG